MRAFLIILGFLGFIIFCALMMPLSYALNLAGMSKQGIGWSQARGTVWDGQIIGLSHQAAPIGNVSLELQTASLLKLSPAYDMQWAGPQGRGYGVLSISTDSLKVEDARAEVRLAAIEGVQPLLRQSDGTLRANIARLEATRAGCKLAAGTLTTDAVQRLGQSYNRVWPALSGDLSCTDGALIVPLTGKSSTGETFTIETRIDPQSGSVTKIRIEGLDAEASLAMLDYGFEPEGTALVYTEILN